MLEAVDATEATSDTVDVLDARRITPLHTAVKVAIQWTSVAASMVVFSASSVWFPAGAANSCPLLPPGLLLLASIRQAPFRGILNPGAPTA